MVESVLELNSASMMEQRMDSDSHEAKVEDKGTPKTLETSSDKTQRSLSMSSFSSLSSASSTLDYDHCCIIANENCMIEEHDCALNWDEFLDCNICRNDMSKIVIPLSGVNFRIINVTFLSSDIACYRYMSRKCVTSVFRLDIT